MKKSPLGMVGLGILIVMPLFAQEPVERYTRVTGIQGYVTRAAAESPKLAEVIGQSLPVRLREGDTVVTGPKSQAVVALDNETQFHLKSNTRVRMKKMLPRN